MAWLESHGNLARHPKTRRLMQRMGWTLPFTIGNLHLLWYWALEYAPTGDLARFEPDQITYDLDLGTATPEQFIEALVESGFLDRSTTGSLRIHDWPDYTTRYIRGSKFRRKSEKWLEVCELYGLPEPKPRQRPASREYDQKVGNALRAVRRDSPSAMAESTNSLEHGPQGAVRVDCVEQRSSRHGGSEASGGERNQMAFQAVPRGNTSAIAEIQSDPGAPAPTISNGDLFEPDHAAQSNDAPPSDSAGAEHEQNQAVPPRRDTGPQNGVVPIPKSLAEQIGFVTTWWPKYLGVYKSNGYPFNAYEQTQALAKLAEHPSKAVSILKHSVQTLTAHPERTRPGWSKNPTARPERIENST